MKDNDLKDIFLIFDADGNGMVDADEFHKMIMHIDPSIDQQKITAYLTKNKLTNMTFDNFKNFMACLESNESYLERIFRESDGGTKKTMAQFQAFIDKTMQLRISNEEKSILVQMVDENNDEFITLDEMKKWMNAAQFGEKQ
ncbi:MAG: hypothetical protein MHMPM18_000759 [Marteilia pararefringens]